MSLQRLHLRQDKAAEVLPAARLDRRLASPGLSTALLRDGLVSADDMVAALQIQSHSRGRLSDILLSHRMVTAAPLQSALAQHSGAVSIDLAADPPDIRLVDQLGAGFCLKYHLVPWRDIGGVTVIASAYPEEFEHHRDHLAKLFGAITLAVTGGQAIQSYLLAVRGPNLAALAESRVNDAESCRDLPGIRLVLPCLVVLAILVMAMAIWPLAPLWILLSWAVLTLLLATALKAAAAIATLTLPRKPRGTGAPIAPLSDDALPHVSLMVALYHESDIAARLLQRLGRLNYPRDRLEILLVVEAEDQMTRDALARTDFPPWMRVVVVPDGRIKTKPRALNFALDQCLGSIVGVYDAEDAPDPDQIRKVAACFGQSGPEIACLQGILDFYNPSTNWLSRCFTIEYAVWFRMILPGIARLGLPVPLGGTTLFFRKTVLEELGGWDAHNVTEDADLGMRLYRYGYQTALIDTVTEEEANCRALPWVKQRSRWIKGYMMTWACHMRAPRLLLRQLGLWRFCGFQVLFLGSLSQSLLMPLLWSLWLLQFGLPHPLATALSSQMLFGLMVLFVATEALNMVIAMIALRKTKHRLNRLWVFTLYFYFPLAALASYKAAWEMIRKPFYWDKTAHGQVKRDSALKRYLQSCGLLNQVIP